MNLNRILTVTLMILSFVFSYATENGESVQTGLTAKPVTGEPDSKPDEERNPGRRLPSRIIPCVISEAGVSFQMGCPPEILVYEIADIEGNVIASFGDETSFVQTLFSLTGEYTVVFTTAEYVYGGYVDIHI